MISKGNTIVSRFLDTAKRQSKQNAVQFKRKELWHELSWNKYYNLVENLAMGLKKLGLAPKDRVAIMSSTRVEWAALDLAILGSGAVTVPLYPSASEFEVAEILKNAAPKILILENLQTYLRFQETFAELNLPGLSDFIIIEASQQKSIHQSQKLWWLDHLVETGREDLKSDPTFYKNSAGEVQPEDLATIIYTSGTSGIPKGVELTHTQLMSEVNETFPIVGVSSVDTTLTFLPFSHVLGRIELWGQAVLGFTIGYAESIERLENAFQHIRPTVICSVPRVFEKIYNKIIATSEISPLRKRIFDWSMAVGREVSRAKQNRKAIQLKTVVENRIASKVLFEKVRNAFGGRLRFAISGGAPLSRNIAEFFHAAGILILEGYGLTETTAAVCVNTPFDFEFGTVGKPIGDVKISFAEDGEILVQSKKVMRSYFNNPMATAEVLEGGWFHTGDIGEFTERGHLKITDRKKELIKTAGGKYIAPLKLETALCSLPPISQAFIYGDRQKYVVALITLETSQIKSLETQHAARRIQDPSLIERVRKNISVLNSSLGSFETIKNFALLDREFTVESGELTPSLKLKRKVITERYQDLLDSLYSTSSL